MVEGNTEADTIMSSAILGFMSAMFVVYDYWDP